MPPEKQGGTSELDAYKPEIKMEYINYYNIPLINEFIHTYGKTINELASQTNNTKRSSSIHFITEKHHPKSFDYLFDFVEKSFFFKISGNIVAYHEGNCDALNLSKEECFAMLAHEFGHLMLVSTKEKDFLKRELIADKMAVQLGLKDHLVSGLMKFLSCEGMENKKQIQDRIERCNEM